MRHDSIFTSLKSDVIFREIDLRADLPHLLDFARDLFAISFDDPKWFDNRFGSEGQGYIDWLIKVTGGSNAFASFATIDGRPVGMVVVGNEVGYPGVGHVYHYYLSSSVRGLGIGAVLNDYALSLLAERGLFEARLHVAPRNLSAIRFYIAHGWEMAGPAPGKEVVVMTTRGYRA